jgi:hypothetical protein
MSTITYNGTFGIYTILDEEVLLDLFEAKIIDKVLGLREPSPEPISFTLALELVASYILSYNRVHKAGCQTIRDVAEFELMRIRAGAEYSLDD